MNKYTIYVSKNDLHNFIKDNDIKDERRFRDCRDFGHVYEECGDAINYFDSNGDFINGWRGLSFLQYVCNTAVEVSPEDFLIAIGYLPEKQKVSYSKVSPIKAEDIHYICELDGKDYLSVEKAPGQDTVYIKAGRDSSVYTAVKLSPEGLIELGSDLVRLGVSLRDGTYEE